MSVHSSLRLDHLDLIGPHVSRLGAHLDHGVGRDFPQIVMPVGRTSVLNDHFAHSAIAAGLAICELGIFLGKNYLITVHNGHINELRTSTATSSLGW